jgi:Paraquat-inducible protein A
MTSTRKLFTAAMIVLALALLYPGVTQPVLTLTGTIEKSDIATLGIEMVAGEGADSQTRGMLTAISSLMGLDRIEGQLEVYNNTRSIWSTASELVRSGNMLVGMLIVLFSVIIPTLKLLLQLVSLFLPNANQRGALLWLNAVLSKWSMADVFVMALLVSYMAGSASGHMGDLLAMGAQLERGFYFFLAYCLFSVAVSSMLREPGGAATATPS